MALAQQTEVLLLDEPTTYLDVTHQLEVLDVVRDLNRERGITVGIVLHDLNLAARYADHLVAVHRGEIPPRAPCRGHHRADGPRGVRPGRPHRPRSRHGTPMVLPLGRDRTDTPPT